MIQLHDWSYNYDQGTKQKSLFSPGSNHHILGSLVGRNPIFGLCRGRESIPRPRAYESPALPLSYLGILGGAAQILLCEFGFVNKSQAEYLKQYQRGHACEDRQQAVFCPGGNGDGNQPREQAGISEADVKMIIP
jgi:hypothetical protein